MKKTFLGILIIAVTIILYKLIIPKDYRRDSRHFFCDEKGHCVTMWRTVSGVCYVIPGKYTSVEYPPTSESYITSPFTLGMNIIWEKKTDNMIADLEDDKSQIIHQSVNGIKIINYNLNKIYNDSTFMYSDKHYKFLKKDVDYIHLDIKEEYARGPDSIKEYK